jgi:tetratricopeptide (TPR) repeat protein
MLLASEKVASATKSYSAIFGFWRLCFGNNDHLLTEWPAEFSIENRKGGRQVIWLKLSALREIGADVEDLELVRMPLQTCLVLDGKISDGTPTYGGRTLAECRAAIADGTLFFDRGVYGRKLTALQVKASHQYSLALYSYWNCGDAGKALLLLDEALKDDPNFYDALVLKIASHACLGDVAESENIGRQLLAMHLPFPKFGSF